MATIAGVSLSAPTMAVPRPSTRPAAGAPITLRAPWSSGNALRLTAARRRHVAVAMAAPDKLSEKVAESIKEAEEACSEDPASGECVAAWDEVEELSAAASHARDKKKAEDPLEEYCKDNPEVDECRTYED